MELWFTEEVTEGVRFSVKVQEQLFHGKSDFQTVDVYDTVDFGRVMTIDGKFMVTERDEFIYHDMIAHVPLMAHPDPKRVLIVGGGDGGTLREVLKHPGVETAVLCEIDGLVIDAARRFLPGLSCGFDDPRADVQVADGIDYVRNVTEPFDVILVDSTDPEGPATGLFNEAFYRSVDKALTDEGLLVVQSEGPLWNTRMVREIHATLESLYPIARLYTFPVPTYPLGYWSFTFASKRHGPMDRLDAERAAGLETRYYNLDVHRAAFALPNFIRRETFGSPDA